MYADLAVLAIFALLFSVIAGRVERSLLTGPIIYVAFGVIGGPVLLGFLDLDVQTFELRVIAELTLALVLFHDASNANLKTLRSHSNLPLRLLLIGLPLCIATGAFTALQIFPQMTFYEACILATMLAATDAALSKGLFNNKEVPARIRESLNAESGLNDGLCVPVLLVFLALATGDISSNGDTLQFALRHIGTELGIGVAVGLGLTLISAKLMAYCWQRNWFTDIWLQVPVVALALACFATAQSLGGSGYIASFAGGLLFGYFARRDTHELIKASEGIAELLAMLTWVIFGAVTVGQTWNSITLDVFTYSLLSLTVIRILPIMIALIGSGEKLETRLFLGWFGPRGLASIVFFVIVASYDLPSESILIQVAVCTITLCVVANGLTANLWAKRLVAT